MGTIELDDRGRVTIPQEIRKRLRIEPGDSLEITIEDGDVRLRTVREGIAFARRDNEWGEEAFLDAGEAMFGDE